MRQRFRMALTALALWPTSPAPVWALDLSLPTAAEKTADLHEAFGSLRLATGPFAQGTLPTQLAEGQLAIASYRFPLEGRSSLQILQTLQDQITRAGYQTLFTCETEACGGFDFRYGIKVLPEPDMHVNLGDFRYSLAQSAKGDFLALLISRSTGMGFVQITQLGETVTIADQPGNTAQTALAKPKPAETPVKPIEASGLVERLESGQATVLEDLIFASGSSTLADGEYGSLAVLAQWLAADATRKVVLIGHTDASGSLEGNIKLSQLRAESVRQTVLFAHKISPNQIEAEGVGFLAPRDSNLTEAGRQKNRRVEVMATSTGLLAP